MSGHVPRPPGQGQDPPARHLRIVPKDPPPKPPQREKYKRTAPTFTHEENDRLRAALRRACALFGSWECLADALRVGPQTPRHAARGRYLVSGDLAIRLARALGVPLESLYAAPSDAAVCPTCGARRAP